MSNEEIKFFDAFSGYGGFHLAIKRALNSMVSVSTHTPSDTTVCDEEQERRGIRATVDKEQMLLPGVERGRRAICVGHSEINTYANAVYQYNFNEQKGNQTTNESINFGNIRNIEPESLPDFDLFCGGFPCQAFSIAGKRQGFLDSVRGTLFFEIARICQVKKPRWLLLENVAGLLSHESGRTFKIIVTTLAELGYTVEWQVLNAKDFGIPHNRPRVFIIGHLGGIPRRQVFPFGRNESIHFEESASQSSYLKSPLRSQGDKAMIQVAGTLEGGGWEKRHEQIRRVHSPSGIAPTTPTGTGGGVMTKIAVPVLTPGRKEKRQNGRRMKTDGEPMFTLTGQDQHGVLDGCRIRRLTPLECERLMGLPDEWTKYGIKDGKVVPISDSQRYKLCGNGVVIPVVEQIVRKLFDLT